jgi:hypothetical protein
MHLVGVDEHDVPGARAPCLAARREGVPAGGDDAERIAFMDMALIGMAARLGAEQVDAAEIGGMPQAKAAAGICLAAQR